MCSVLYPPKSQLNNTEYVVMEVVEDINAHLLPKFVDTMHYRWKLLVLGHALLANRRRRRTCDRRIGIVPVRLR